MNKSTLFVGYRNYQIKSEKQYKKLLKHILRTIVTENIDIDKSKLNEFFYFENNEKITNLDPEEIEEKFLLKLKNMFEDYKEENHTNPEMKKKNEQLIEQRRNTKKRLMGKDLSLEEYEESGLSVDEYINKNWSKEYKSEKMTLRMKKRTKESLNKYLKLKDEVKLKDKKKIVNGYNTMFQEIVFKIPLSNGWDWNDTTIKNIIDDKIKLEKEKGNEVLLVSLHKDESSIHPHMIFINKDFQILKNQKRYLIDKYNLDFDINNLTDEQLKTIGQLTQKEDYELCNKRLPPKRKFVLVNEVNDKISNEERMENNKIINRKNSYKNKNNIENRRFNYVNMKNEQLNEQKLNIKNYVDELKYIKLLKKMDKEQKTLNFLETKLEECPKRFKNLIEILKNDIKKIEDDRLYKDKENLYKKKDEEYKEKDILYKKKDEEYEKKETQIKNLDKLQSKLFKKFNSKTMINDLVERGILNEELRKSFIEYWKEIKQKEKYGNNEKVNKLTNNVIQAAAESDKKTSKLSVRKNRDRDLELGY